MKYKLHRLWQEGQHDPLASGLVFISLKVPRRCFYLSNSSVHFQLRHLLQALKWTVTNFHPCHRHHRLKNQLLRMEFRISLFQRAVESSLITATVRNIVHQRFHRMHLHWTLWRLARWMLASVSLTETDRFRCHHDHQEAPFHLIYRQVHHRGDVWWAAGFQSDQLKVLEKRDVYKHRAAYRKRQYLLEGEIYKNESLEFDWIISIDFILDVIFRERHIDVRQIRQARVARERILVKVT